MLGVRLPRPAIEEEHIYASSERATTASRPPQVTELLLAWGQGDQAALEQLMPLVHGELRRLARRHMGHERVGHTLQATALVNEAYLRLIEIHQVQWQNRAHFFAMSVQADAAHPGGLLPGRVIT